MSITRTIVALLIALSVAILPAAGSAGVSVKSPEAAGISITEDMPDCCLHKANPCEQAMDDCVAMATCAHGFGAWLTRAASRKALVTFVGVGGGVHATGGEPSALASCLET